MSERNEACGSTESLTTPVETTLLEAVNEHEGEPDVFDNASEPVILLDAKRLSGYIPTEDDQAKVMMESLRKALFGDTGLYHEEKLVELYSTRKAKHGISSGYHIQNEFLELPYPELLRESLKTQTVWIKLNQPHEIPVVQRILVHLISCQQPLLWKFDMRCEILRIVHEEMSFRELEDWKKRRSAELEQLYMVRETIEHRVKLAVEEELHLLKKRDQAIVERMGLRAGLTSFDLRSTVFCFPETGNEIMGFSTDNDAIYFERDEESSDEGSWNQNHTDDKLRLEEHQHAEKLQAATDVENSVLEECTSSALRVAMAKAAALKKKLVEVDDLLESLQDEEWAEADDEVDSNQLMYPHPRDSLLMPILAMVLGSCEMQPTSLIQEHRDIVEAWEAFFGRLPPIPPKGPKKDIDRENFGLVDNDGDWEDLDSSVSSNDEFSKTH